MRYYFKAYLKDKLSAHFYSDLNVVHGYYVIAYDDRNLDLLSMWMIDNCIKMGKAQSLSKHSDYKIVLGNEEEYNWSNIK